MKTRKFYYHFINLFISQSTISGLELLEYFKIFLSYIFELYFISLLQNNGHDYNNQLLFDFFKLAFKS